MVSIIAAIGKNRELGKNNRLLWNIPEDMKRFRDLTTGKIVIIGRKTYESLPDKFRPLPNRVNIVVTRDPDYKIKGAIITHSIEEAVKTAKKSVLQENSEIFIIGGAQIYKQGLKHAEKLYLTLVDKEFPDADTYFPEYSEFVRVLSEKKSSNDELMYKFIELSR